MKGPSQGKRESTLTAVNVLTVGVAAAVCLLVFSTTVTATGQGVETSGDDSGAASRPEITGLELAQERWTCSVDGTPLRGTLLKPGGDGPFPAIVLSHGLGGNAEGIAFSRGREFVRWGFVCIATDYTHAGEGRRGARGQRKGRRAGVTGDFRQFGARPENIRRGLACLAILQQQEDVDERRIAAYGHSMGAFVTIALTAAAPDSFAAAAITSGGIRIAGGHTAAAPKAAVAAHVRAPFLILQGADDTTVPPQSSEQLRQELAKNGVPTNRHVFEGVGHRVPSERASDCYRLMRAWFTERGVLLNPTAAQGQ